MRPIERFLLNFSLRPIERLSLNFSLLILLGVLACLWVFLFTEWFPVIEGLLGLGGVFIWIAFSFRFLSDETQKRLKLAFEHRVLERQDLPWFLAAAFLGLFSWASCHGSLELDSLADDHSHFVRLSECNAAPAKLDVREVYLPEHAKVSVLRTTPVLRSRTFMVRPTGLPARCVEVQGLWRTPLHFPASLLKTPVLLIRPSPTVTTSAVSNKYILSVWINNQRKVSLPYQGSTVWLGAGRDVAIPANLQNFWRFELKTRGMDESV